MRVGSVRTRRGSKHIVAESEMGVLDLTQVSHIFPDTMPASLRAVDLKSLVTFGERTWDSISEVFESIAKRAPYLILDGSDLRMDVPLVPEKIIGIGHNYKDLLRAIPMDPPESPKLFAKWPTTLLCDGDDVILPPQLKEVSYEAELVVVIGKGGRDIPSEEALSHVFGYSIADDITATDAIRADGGELVRSKNYDTFLPLGPWITAARDVKDVQDLPIILDQNGKTRQKSSTREMVFSVQDLISFASSVATLKPGDLILTGSPAGVARFHNPPAYLKPGDQIRVTIGSLGALSHGVRGW